MQVKVTGTETFRRKTEDSLPAVGRTQNLFHHLHHQHRTLEGMFLSYLKIGKQEEKVFLNHCMLNQYSRTVQKSL